MPREYTYPARITSVELADHKNGNGWSTEESAKGHDEETERVIVNVEYPSGATDRFNCGGQHRDEFVINRRVQIVLRLPEIDTKGA